MSEKFTDVPLWLLIQAWATGVALGVMYFGGLWLTVRGLMGGKSPARWVLGSFLARNGVAVVGFYMVAGDNWRRLLSSLVGFIVARYLLIRMTRIPVDVIASIPQPAKGTRHAP